MKTLIKSIVTVMCLLSFASLSAQENDSTILLTKENNKFNLEFLNSDNVIGMQFDIALKGVNKKNVSLDSCLKGLPASHVGRCAFVKNGNLRVVIFSTTNSVLESGTLGSLDLTGNGIDSLEELKFQKVIMVGPQSRKINGSTLIDIGKINNDRLHEDRNK